MKQPARTSEMYLGLVTSLPSALLATHSGCPITPPMWKNELLSLFFVSVVQKCDAHTLPQPHCGSGVVPAP